MQLLLRSASEKIVVLMAVVVHAEHALAALYAAAANVQPALQAHSAAARHLYALAGNALRVVLTTNAWSSTCKNLSAMLL